MEKKDLIRIRLIMLRYHRTEGYVSIEGSPVLFFDSKPSIPHAHITLESINNSLNP